VMRSRSEARPGIAAAWVRRLPEARPPWRSPQGSAATYRPIFDIHPASS
jgi:hypothetical protein